MSARFSGILTLVCYAGPIQRAVDDVIGMLGQASCTGTVNRAAAKGEEGGALCVRIVP